VVYEELERTTDTTRREPGMRAGFRRTGRYRTVRAPIYDRFTPTVTRPVPWGYALGAADTSAVNLLRLHGIVVEKMGEAWRGDAGPQFETDSTKFAAQEFERRREVTLVGRWVPGQTVMLVPGTWIVRTAQPLGVLAMYLLEPESDDGIVQWNIGGRANKAEDTAPVIRLARPLPVRIVPAR
jgi:hypothetical protein